MLVEYYSAAAVPSSVVPSVSVGATFSSVDVSSAGVASATLAAVLAVLLAFSAAIRKSLASFLAQLGTC
jgi:hypothetical protein